MSGIKVLDTDIPYDKSFLWYVKANEQGNISVWKSFAKRGRPKKQEESKCQEKKN